MSEQENQDSQKTVVAFIAGLLVGGLLVWVFSSPANEEMESTNEDGITVTVESNDDNVEVDANDEVKETVVGEVKKPVKEMSTGKGSVEVDDQSAGNAVVVSSATFPSDEGWIGVRDYSLDQLSGLLGVARFSKEQGLVPSQIDLLRPTVPGNEYAVVFYSESGDREFNLANDIQVEGVMSTFIAK